MRSGIRVLRVALVSAFAACIPKEPPPPVPVADSGLPRPDGGPFVVGRDGGSDGAGLDASPRVDAQVAGDAGTRALPTIDGTIRAGEWDDAMRFVSETPSSAPFERDTLRRLYALRTRERLYLAIEGSLEAPHAFLVYVDADHPSDRGVLLSGSTLSDRTGSLDRALSATLFAAPDLRPDYAWGTTIMPRTPAGSDDRTGWRILAREDDFRTVEGAGDVSACSTTACETSIAIGPGGIERATDIALFVRLGDAEGNLSNQTLPLDDPRAPELVGRIALLRPP
jgi:hypothetical protein